MLLVRNGLLDSGETEKVLSRRQSEILPTGETALVGSLPSTRSVDLSKPVSTSSSESLPRLVKVISRMIHWLALQTSKLSRFW